MGKILIKNKKSSNETQTPTKKTQDAASTAASTQENQASSGEARSHFCLLMWRWVHLRVEPEGGAAAEETEEQEDTEEQDEEKMKTSDEVECASHQLPSALHP